MTKASSSSSSNPTSLTRRVETIFKKAYELSILCGIEVCVIYYGADGELKTWPEEREKVKDMALRYKEAKKRKKSFSLHEFVDDQENKDESEKKKKKKQKKNVKYRDWYPIFDHYSSHQLSQLIQSLEQTLSALQGRLRVVKEQKRKKTDLVHHHQYDQTQPLNHPRNFSLFMYNHEDATLSQLPISASDSNLFHLMQQDQLFGFDQNISNRNVLDLPCVSNTPLESAVNNYLMQQEEQNMCMMSELTNTDVLQDPSFSNTVPHEFPYDFQQNLNGDVVPYDFQQNPNGDVVPYDFQQNPIGDVAGITSFAQDMFSSYNDNSLLQTSSLPSLHTVLTGYCLSNNSPFLS